MRKNLTKKERLSKKKDLDAVFSGNKNQTKGLKLYYKQNNLLFNRVVFVPINRYKNSVKRNRSRRIMHEVYRNIKPHIKCGYDLVFVLFPGYDYYSTRNKQIRYLFRKTDILEND